MKIWAASAAAAMGLWATQTASPARAADVCAPASGASIEAATAGLERKAGLVPVYLDRRCGRVLIALKPSGQPGEYGRYLYQVYLRAGLGSTPTGLDRSAPADTQILAFQRAGGHIIANLENTQFRAEHGSADEARAVRESFASSSIWAGDILAQGGDGSVLIDLSGFLARDAFGAADALKAAHQGSFHTEAALSYPDVAETQVFPENLEFDAHQTLVSDEPGAEVSGIAPLAHNVTLIEHVSLIKLPPPGFQPRLSDPRTGAIDSLVADYSSPLGDPLVIRLAHRFRLEKVDPTAARSRVKKPIVFYVDRAAPEPVRSALLEGASWWTQAFDAAGFIDAFRVEVLPEGVSPLDARYNVINWVHRQTRGWSFGANIIDPRTGEIVKGTVLLGSQRMRQDRLIFEGLAGADKTGTGAQDDPIRVAMARLRQLSVHETGHALGLEHNFAASAYGDRESVMDYPPPRIRVLDGKLDFSDAYRAGIGSWDRFAIHWLYDEAAPGADQTAELAAIIRDGYAQGLKFVADADARPTESANPLGALWDDGPDPVAELDHVLKVRRIALDRFGLANLPAGAPVADLKRGLVPLYLFHRYEVDATAKLIGGVDFGYPVKGDADPVAREVAGPAQKRALAALLGTLDPEVLALPSPLIDLLSAGEPMTRDKAFDIEVFGASRTPVFDLSTAAAAAADITLGDLLNPARLNRVADQGARDKGQLGLGELLNQTFAAAFPTASDGGARGLTRRAVQARLVAKLAADLRDPSLSPGAAAQIRAGLADLGKRLDGAKGLDGADLAQAHALAAVLLDGSGQKLKALAETDQAHHPEPPPGMPIGGGEDCWLCEDLGL